MKRSVDFVKWLPVNIPVITKPALNKSVTQLFFATFAKRVPELMTLGKLTTLSPATQTARWLRLTVVVMHAEEINHYNKSCERFEVKTL